MTSFPVCKQSLINRKRCEIEQKLQLTTNIKSGSAFQNPHINWGGTPPNGENVMTSFPVYKQSLITRNSETVRDRAKVTINH